MDQDVINLAKAIRQKESGGNFNATGDAGTSKGGYQWQKATWKANARDILGDENAEMTPSNQNAVAYGVILKDKQKGLNPAQIAAKWNSGKTAGWENMVGTTTINGQKIKYNVPQYVKDVTDHYQQLKGSSSPIESMPSTSELADNASAQQHKTLFPSKTGDSAFSAAAKTVGNVIPSAFQFGKNVLLKMVNPVETVNNLKQIPQEFKALSQEAGGAANAFKATVKETPKSAYEALVPSAARNVIKGDTESAQRDIVNDPFGSIAPFLLAAKGGAKAIDRAQSKSAMSSYVENIADNYKKPIPRPSTTFNDAFETGMKKTSELVTKPASVIAGKVSRGTTSATKFGIGQATGLSPDTLTEVIKTPSAFTRSAMKATGDRASLGQEVQSSLQKRAATLEETGKAYEPVRNSGTNVKVDKGFVQNVVRETTGVDIKKGKVTTSGTATIRDATEIRALQNLIDLWDPVFKKGEVSATEFLNFRADLAKLSKFERQIGVSRPLENVSKIMRGRLNEAYRPQLKGLDKLDESFSSQRAELNSLSKNLLVDRNGGLTEAAINRIANATGKGKDALLGRLEEIAPGITQKIKILKAVEDIQNASGIKVGAYTRTALVGGGFVRGGPIMAAVNAILTSPQLAVPILRSYGLIKNSSAVRAVVNALRQGGSAVNNLPSKVPTSTTFGNKELISQ